MVSIPGPSLHVKIPEVRVEEWPSRLRHHIQKVSGSNQTRCLAGITDQISL